MQLEHLTIARNPHSFAHSGLEPGQVGGKIKFSGNDGSTVEVILQPHHVESILAIVSDRLVEQTRAVAETLTAQIIEHAPRFLSAEVA